MSAAKKSTRRLRRAAAVSGASLLLAPVLAAGMLSSSGASSHREAPLSSKDPVTDLTDVYAFVSPDSPDSVTLIANVIPLEDPAGGPNFYNFGDDVKYEIHVDNDGDAVDDLEYEFRFTTTISNPDTFLYNTGPIESLDDPDWNYRQTYVVSRCDDSGCRDLGQGVVPPANIGPRSTPDYPALAEAAVLNLDDGTKVFAGPRDDPFFVDTGSIFDLGGLRPLNEAHLIPLPTEAGVDGLAGKNVHTIALQVPIDQLTNGEEPVIGVFANTYRQRNTHIKSDGTRMGAGGWVGVSRLGMPLVNEVVVPLGSKDLFNASKPVDDAQFLPSVINPELANLIPVLYPGVEVPTEVPFGLGTGGREDVATVFLTGIPGVNQPANVVPSEMLRLNTTTPSSFPNGRMLSDDVVDTELRVLAGVLAEGFDVSPNNLLGDGVDANDVDFMDHFPYVALPHQGY